METKLLTNFTIDRIGNTHTQLEHTIHIYRGFNSRETGKLIVSENGFRPYWKQEEYEEDKEIRNRK